MGILKDPEVVGNESSANQHSITYKLSCYSATSKRLNVSIRWRYYFELFMVWKYSSTWEFK